MIDMIDVHVEPIIDILDDGDVDSDEDTSEVE